MIRRGIRDFETPLVGICRFLLDQRKMRVLCRFPPFLLQSAKSPVKMVFDQNELLKRSKNDAPGDVGEGVVD
ncbi:hypothetical protein HMPREF3213_00856 [Heyndrickxia coagulans]|uniref:Uncharacterized protein n=1 Tax=Heyndrickxia coagulans TaxID=1398 RepID=A0A133KXL4_HEYCO|nr:hypothetical protein HMPREF3213_00856 [Heyndrickxia coagulans]